MDESNFYITSTLPYVNADPHVGFATEIIRADVIARYKKLLGFDVFFNTGTDEHGQKLFEAAEKAGKDVKVYVDEYAEKFKGLKDILGLSPDIHFIRTTDPEHEKAAIAFWKKVSDNGYIYKKNYKIKYCVGCESEKTESELQNGRCILHPDREIQIIEEENYFFKLSEFGDRLTAFYDANREFVIPMERFNEMREFVKRGLEDFSISRLKEKMSWGVPVPGDPNHVMYVWFDALVSYISTLGWPDNTEQFEKFWKEGSPVQYCGKDNTRFQAVMWQAMLMAAELPNSHTIVVDGFITGEGGIKMSKSLGNVINPYNVVEEYGTDALRYFVLRELHPFEDSPFTLARFKDAYNANLANGLGNLVSRIMKMASDNLLESPVRDDQKVIFSPLIQDNLERFNLKQAMDLIWGGIDNANEKLTGISGLDEKIQKEQPFKVVKTDKEKGIKLIMGLVMKLLLIAKLLEPFLPETSQQIQKLIKENKSPEKPLFARKD